MGATDTPQEEEHESPAREPHADSELETPLVLRDGTSVRVRAIRPDDTERLRAFHTHLSPDTIIFRFFHFLPELSAHDAERFTHVDYVNRMALVATSGSEEAEEILGVVRYDRIKPDTAEVAFVVEDQWQGHGIATALLHRLAAYARQRDISTFVAITMGNNLRMLDVLRNCGFPATTRFEEGNIEVYLDITAPPKPPHALTQAMPQGDRAGS